jgi:hypothetical protein
MCALRRCHTSPAHAARCVRDNDRRDTFRTPNSRRRPRPTPTTRSTRRPSPQFRACDAQRHRTWRGSPRLKVLHPCTDRLSCRGFRSLCRIARMADANHDRVARDDLEGALAREARGTTAPPGRRDGQLFASLSYGQGRGHTPQTWPRRSHEGCGQTDPGHSALSEPLL